MTITPGNLDRLEFEAARLLVRSGLFLFGWFGVESGGKGTTDRREHAGLLIGNRQRHGRHPMWDVFSLSEEFGDGDADPLDRWSRRIIGPIARQLGGEAIYPFGETLWPFQQFAKQATGMKASPLGILIHPQYGLWQAFRGAIVFADLPFISEPARSVHPCDACPEKPCLSACPVDAFSAQGFAVSDCRSHLAAESEPHCMQSGCGARAACPVGNAYGEEQVRFHMKAYSGG
jgi:hypothetical protein